METSSSETRFLRVQLEVAQAALSSLQPNVLIQTLLDTIGRAQGYREGIYWRVVEDAHEAVVEAAFGEAMGRFLGCRQELGDPGSYIARVICTRQPLGLNRLQESPFGRHPMTQSLKAQAVLALPLVQRTGRVVGALAFVDEENPDRFTVDDLTEGMILAHRVAQALENAESCRQVQRVAAQYRLVIESLHDAVYIVDASGQITCANPAWAQLTGYPVEALLGRASTGFFASGLQPLFPDGRQAFQGELVPPPLEAEVIRNDGARVPVELSMTDLVVDGKSAGHIAVVRDITRRKRAEEKFRIVVDAAPNAMIMIDQAGDIVLVNSQAEALFGYTREELMGQPIEQLVPARFRRGHLESRANFFATPRARPMGDGRDLYGLRKDGGEVPVEIGFNPLTTDEGTFVLASIIDITARKQAEERLRQAAAELTRSNSELEQFAYVASHDLQEPLRAVAGCVQALQRRSHGRLDPPADELIRHAVDGAIRMQNLINDLLEYARVATRGKPFVPTDCAAIVRDAIANLEVAMTESGALVTYEDLPTVMVDPTQLTQLFQNLIGNACKFRGQHPPAIRIAAEHKEGEWLFSVRGNGIGIEAQYFERIFGLFQRLHTRAEYAGTGIGLAICKKIIERHGGRIWVESQQEKGSTFSFSIPDQR
jgi:PAS domain S-box-containing protein